MSNLANDIARCAGRITKNPLGQIGSVCVTSNVGNSECVRCRRREPGHPDYQPHMIPPDFVAGKCPERIAP